MVVGASVGIGRAACERFAAEGAIVVVTSRSSARCDEIAAAIEARGGTALSVPVDVAEEGAVAAAVERTTAAFGRLDGAFNNAGVQSVPRPAAEHTVAEWDRVFAVNVRGTWLAMRAQIPAILASGGGAIVNTTSVGGIVGSAGIAPYVASKHAVVGLTKASAIDYARRGIRINALAPGAVRTAMLTDWLGDEELASMAQETPQGRIGEPEEIAGAAAWLLSDDASFATGTTLTLDGGYTIV